MKFKTAIVLTTLSMLSIQAVSADNMGTNPSAPASGTNVPQSGTNPDASAAPAAPSDAQTNPQSGNSSPETNPKLGY